MTRPNSFFRNILRGNPHQHPLLYLKGVKYNELLSVLNFMYQGEVRVDQDELNSFLALAEDLCVKGLTQNNFGTSSSKHHQEKVQPIVKSEPVSVPAEVAPQQQQQQSQQQVAQEDDAYADESCDDADESYDDAQIRTLYQREEEGDISARGGWRCLSCGHNSRTQEDMHLHVEAKHVSTGGFNCPLCGHYCPSLNSLRNHKHRCLFECFA